MDKAEKDRQLEAAKQQLQRSEKLEPIKNRFEAVLKAKIVGQAMPTKVLEALDVIRDYLQQLKSDDQRRSTRE